MCTIRPILRHFLLWLLLLPLVAVEVRALDEAFTIIALKNPTRTEITKAQVTDTRGGDQLGELQIQYHFQTKDSDTWYSATDLTGRRNLWIAINQATWTAALQDGKIIDVAYLPSDPWMNRPAGQAGNPIADSFCLWSGFLAIDMYSIYEFIQIVRNYLRCRGAARRMHPCRLRYWESAAIWESE